MKLYRIWQTIYDGYDTYDSAIVCAKNEDEARSIHPNGKPWDGTVSMFDTWCSKKHVQVEFIGTAKSGTPKGVILSSFNAG